VGSGCLRVPHRSSRRQDEDAASGRSHGSQSDRGGAREGPEPDLTQAPRPRPTRT
jgi:hypothetical protein